MDGRGQHWGWPGRQELDSKLLILPLHQLGPLGHPLGPPSSLLYAVSLLPGTASSLGWPPTHHPSLSPGSVLTRTLDRALPSASQGQGCTAAPSAACSARTGPGPVMRGPSHLPAFFTKPRSASSTSHSSQRKHPGCQLLFMALMTRPMMNSPGGERFLLASCPAPPRAPPRAGRVAPAGAQGRCSEGQSSLPTRLPGSAEACAALTAGPAARSEQHLEVVFAVLPPFELQTGPADRGQGRHCHPPSCAGPSAG